MIQGTVPIPSEWKTNHASNPINDALSSSVLYQKSLFSSPTLIFKEGYRMPPTLPLPIENNQDNNPRDDIIPHMLTRRSLRLPKRSTKMVQINVPTRTREDVMRGICISICCCTIIPIGR